MPIEFRCTQCNKLLRTGDDTAGKQAKCPECGTVMTVPLPDQGPVPPNRPMGSFEAAPSPFAAPSAPVAPDSMNPYQSPTGLGPEPHSFAPPGQVQPTRIDFGETLSRTWSVFTERWLTMVGALFLAGLLFLPAAIALNVVNAVVVPTVGDQAVRFAVAILSQIVYQIYIFWIMIGVQLFSLGVVRGEEPRYGLILSGGRYLLAIVLCGILTQIIVMLGLVLLIIPGLIFAMMLIQAQLLIIDRNMGVIDAMSTSRDVMVGNKMTVFALFLVASLVGGVFAVITCGLGIFGAVPYMWILTVMIYLGVTGQPTMIDHHMMPPEQPAPGTPPGNSPFAS
jgi:phage FluMu protein Com